jgi:myo-inositol 2-dehydrogenase/D-chiro-inositol 1-dehydrogenase
LRQDRRISARTPYGCAAAAAGADLTALRCGRSIALHPDGSTLVCALGDRLAVLCGDDALTLGRMACVARGVISVARNEDCLRTVEKNRSTLMIGFNRRFDPNFAALEKRLRVGAIGNIEMATIISRDPAPPPASYVKSSRGIFRDMMIHDLDLARFLVGEEFVTVQALGAALVDKAIGDEGDCDTAAVQMQTASGKIAVITNSRRASYGYDQRIEVHGSMGMLRAGNIHNTTVEVATADGFNADPILHFFTERYGQAYANEVLTFIDAVTNNKPVAPSGHDGLQAQKLADAATESWQSGTPVNVA